MGHDPERIHELTERGALSEQHESNLGIWQLPQSLEKLCCLTNSLLSVRVAKLIRADWTPQEFEVSIRPKDDIRWEEGAIESGVNTCGRNNLAFRSIELKADPSGGLFDPVKGLGDSRLVPCQAQVIEVRKYNLETSLGLAGLQLLE